MSYVEWISLTRAHFLYFSRRLANEAKGGKSFVANITVVKFCQATTLIPRARKIRKRPRSLPMNTNSGLRNELACWKRNEPN